MPQTAYPQRKLRRRPYYLIPTVIGMCGILFAMQLPMPLRVVVVLLSAAIPAFVGGYMLATLPAAGGEKRLLGIGTLFLFIGAIVTASGLSESLVEQHLVSEQLGTLSRWLGTASLLLGLVVTLFSVIRSGEVIEELTDRFGHLAAHISEGFILTARTGRITLVNERLLEMTGTQDRDWVGQRVSEVMKGLEIEPLRAPQREDSAENQEYQVRWAKGPEARHFWVSSGLVRDPRGRVAGTLITIRDITEQQRLAKRLEKYTEGLQQLVEEQTQKLRESQERLRSLLVRMREGFLTLDITFRVRFANERICDMLHVREQDLVGRNLFDFIKPDGAPRFLALLEGAGAETADERTLHEFTLLPHAGAEAPVIIAVAPIADAPRGSGVYSLVVTDVSELKQMQNELERRAAELERVNEELRQHGRAKDTFLTNVSHELRTPLSTVQGYVEMFDSGSLGQLEPPQRAALKVVERNLSRLAALINEMINFSRMEIRGIQLNWGLLDPRRLAQECAGSATPHALSKKLTVHVEVPDEMPFIWGDRQKLAQVLTILLSNAVKFTDEGGAITVRCRQDDPGSVAFAIEDTGIGISPAFQGLVFVKFFQIDSSKARRYEGAGIGLTIAKNIVESHGGQIVLQSVPKHGSTFTVALPRVVFGHAGAPVAELAGAHVLLGIADDEFLEAVCQVLETQGCQVSASTRGYECVRAAQDSQPDLIVLDDHLPDIATSGVLQSLRELLSLHTIPVLLFARSRGSSEFPALPEVRPITMPFTPDELVDHVRHALVADAGWATGPAATPIATPETGGVVLVGMDYDLLEWIDTGLSRRGLICTIAHDLNRAEEVLGDLRPDYVICDADGLDGRAAEVIDRLRHAAQMPDLPVYVLTAQAKQVEDVPGALVLEKPFSLDEMVRALRDGVEIH
jgi:PAS domain S-box-containing protein